MLVCSSVSFSSVVIKLRCEKEDSFSHLSHIIDSRFTDNRYILFRRNSFATQANNALCFFRKLGFVTRIKLFKAFCSSMYGCELWSLNDSRPISEFCVAWRKALRCVINVPYSCHSCFLPLLSGTFPIFHELCKRSIRFFLSCVFSRFFLGTYCCTSHIKYSQVQFRDWLLSQSRDKTCDALIALFCCARYRWTAADLLAGKIDVSNSIFQKLVN